MLGTLFRQATPWALPRLPLALVGSGSFGYWDRNSIYGVTPMVTQCPLVGDAVVCLPFSTATCPKKEKRSHKGDASFDCEF
jgi:hypothetical protein